MNCCGDVIVFAVPMHNFGPPSTLKAWIDHVVRVGRTVSYSQKGPEGMLKGRRAILVLRVEVSIRMARPGRSTSRSRISAQFSASSASPTLMWCLSKESHERNRPEKR